MVDGACASMAVVARVARWQELHQRLAKRLLEARLRDADSLESSSRAHGRVARRLLDESPVTKVVERLEHPQPMLDDLGAAEGTGNGC
eukprot:2461289-Prymnesium_polylepis.1